uniref:50S ribosomal protein L14, chloroplastic n=1 Tax=Solanum lycopersicum TaxID=4081 RepID=A0A3Q7FHM2_SOLLC
MIQPQTHFNVRDNSGATELMTIRVIVASNRQYAHTGDVVVAVMKEAIQNIPLEKLKRDNGMIIRHDDNGAVVIDQEKNPKVTQIFGAITEELRELNFTKIVSLYPNIL